MKRTTKNQVFQATRDGAGPSERLNESIQAKKKRKRKQKGETMISTGIELQEVRHAPIPAHLPLPFSLHTLTTAGLIIALRGIRSVREKSRRLRTEHRPAVHWPYILPLIRSCNEGDLVIAYTRYYCRGCRGSGHTCRL